MIFPFTVYEKTTLSQIIAGQLKAHEAQRKAQRDAAEARRLFEIHRERFKGGACIDVEARVVPDAPQIEGDGFAGKGA